MQNNNLIDLKKVRPAKQGREDKEAEYLVKLEFLRREKQEKTRREAAEKAVLLPEDHEADEAVNENSVSGRTDFSSAPNTFWLKLGKSFLYALIFLLPLFFLPLTIYPVDANKQLLAAILISAALLCYLANAYFTRRIIYSKSILAYAAVFFVFAAGLSAIFSVSPNNSLYGDYTQADVFIDSVIYGLALYLAAVFFKKGDFNNIGISFLASLVILSLLGLLQLFGVYIFPFDFSKQAGFNVFGSVINFDIFIAFGLMLIVAALVEFNFSIKTKAGLVFAGLLFAVNLILINYQPIWILLAMMMVVYAIYKFTFKSEESGASSAGSGIPLAVGIIAFLFALIGPSLPQVVKMPNLPIDVKPNLSATLNISKDALGGLRLITGTGLATFSSQYNSYRPAELNQSDFWRIKFNQGFSFAVTYFTTAGIIGFLSIIFLIYAFARAAMRNLEDKKSMVAAIGGFFMIMSWFYFPAYFIGLIFSFIMLGLLAALDSDLAELEFSRAPKSRAVIALILVIVFTAGAISLLYFSGKKYIAAVYFQNGLKDYGAGNTVKSMENIAKAINLDRLNDQYLRSASQLLLIDAEKTRDLNLEIGKDANFQGKIKTSVDFAKGATEVNPADYENWYNLADVYEKIINIAGGADSFAENSYRKASELNPKNPDSLIGAARVLMFASRQAKDNKIKEEKISGAIDALKKAVELKSDYAASRFHLGLAYTQADRKNEAIKEFEFAKALSDVDASINFQLGILYYNDNDFDKAKTEMEKAISADPNFSNARYVLGLIYDKKGLKDNAIYEFERVLKLNPESVEVKDILNNLKTKGSAFAGENPVSPETLNESLGAGGNNANGTGNAIIDSFDGESPVAPLQ